MYQMSARRTSLWTSNPLKASASISCNVTRRDTPAIPTLTTAGTLSVGSVRSETKTDIARCSPRILTRAGTGKVEGVFSPSIFEVFVLGYLNLVQIGTLNSEG